MARSDDVGDDEQRLCMITNAELCQKKGMEASQTSVFTPSQQTQRFFLYNTIVFPF